MLARDKMAIELCNIEQPQAFKFGLCWYFQIVFRLDLGQIHI